MAIRLYARPKDYRGPAQHICEHLKATNGDMDSFVAEKASRNVSIASNPARAGKSYTIGLCKSCEQRFANDESLEWPYQPGQPISESPLFKDLMKK